MKVTPQDAVANLERRWAERRAEDAAAADQARARLPALAGELRRRGAQRVVLFGSLVEGRFRKDSDIDLAVSGLPQGAELGAMSDLTLLAGRQVEIVPLELAPESLARRIAEVGEEIR